MKMLFRVFKYARPHWLLVVVTIISLIAERLLEMVFPWLTKWTIDHVIAESDLTLLKKIVFLAVSAAVIRFGFAFVHTG